MVPLVSEKLIYAKIKHKKRQYMKLIIHDLAAEQWKQIAPEYEGWTVIADNGKIVPCCGCFGCCYCIFARKREEEEGRGGA